MVEAHKGKGSYEGGGRMGEVVVKNGVARGRKVVTPKGVVRISNGVVKCAWKGRVREVFLSG